jgi:glycosyltransferase involved in cell wall biosynthesis
MNILLLTDIPPCQNLTAGLVLAELCRLVPRGRLSCFTILNPHLRVDYCSDLDWIPMKVVPKPNEFGIFPPAWKQFGAIPAVVIENYRRWISASRLATKAARFSREQKVDVIWAVLQGQTVLRVTALLSRRLNKPIVTQVWDPISWWMRAHNVDWWNRRVAHRQFQSVLRGSSACLTASWAMAEIYEEKFGVRCIPMVASHDPRIAAEPALWLRNEREIVIGMAGQFYADDEWSLLVDALARAGWQIGGRSVRLKILGMHEPKVYIPDRMEFVGWKPQDEAIKILSKETDILYCPYPFTPAMEEVARLSFPSKLPLYFAAGRPVLFHGPDYSSPARYLDNRSAALICREMYMTSVYNDLQRLVEDGELYRRIVENSRRAFLEDFTDTRMRENFWAAFETVNRARRRQSNSQLLPGHAMS